ncbi:hypothetical protein [Pseudomonas sp. EpS/L25]|uniref:hypothetical protein n=1 Tax=Pseudomonas sp. EpS/L25 TaxID=1749078 RepID=UPI000743592C|nr:hypothetical protein [Pseudomonas sp. EpS/L25]KUM34310.1 hypothetical protein AR540_16450 [Pseudomonas sp. EpS/L25]
MTTPRSQRVLVLDGSRDIGAAIVGRVVGAGLQMTVTYATSAARADRLAKAVGAGQSGERVRHLPVARMAKIDPRNAMSG